MVSRCRPCRRRLPGSFSWGCCRPWRLLSHPGLGREVPSQRQSTRRSCGRRCCWQPPGRTASKASRFLFRTRPWFSWLEKKSLSLNKNLTTANQDDAWGLSQATNVSGHHCKIDCPFISGGMTPFIQLLGTSKCNYGKATYAVCIGTNWSSNRN